MNIFFTIWPSSNKPVEQSIQAFVLGQYKELNSP